MSVRIRSRRASSDAKSPMSFANSSSIAGSTFSLMPFTATVYSTCAPCNSSTW
jgi:hypothetical protein